jgi:DNA-binding transcriptional MerR regulator
LEQDLISKKELLELTGISYGQLYRWKRKNLIPEEWFIRKSTFTGQETFFPRDRILPRLERIKDMKDDLSLDDLADVFSPAPTKVSLTKAELNERNIVSKTALDLYEQKTGKFEVFPFEDALHLYVLDKLLKSGEIGLDEGGHLLQVLSDNFRTFEGRDVELICLRKLGVATFLLMSGPTQICFDKETRLVARLNLATCAEELKLKAN